MTSNTSKCPICGKPTVVAYKPFCSKKCADVDLNQWLVGNYRIAGSERVSESNDDEFGDDDRSGLLD